MATMGHLREIRSLDDISLKTWCVHFHPLDDKKKKQALDALEKAVAETDEVILATDDDREGEAIAWHICQIFRLPVETTQRIVFHEIYYCRQIQRIICWTLSDTCFESHL
jgi:DNA topoisomerase-1